MGAPPAPIAAAAAAAAAAPATPSGRPGGAWGDFLGVVNESTKFVVSAVAFATLVAFPNVQTCWCILGSVVNSINGKVLKRVLNHERPEGAVKADPGMPSSHAVSLSYLSVYAARAVAVHGASGVAVSSVVAKTLGVAVFAFPEWTTLPVAGLVMGLGLFLTWLRVALGYHTPPQVIVGYGMGAGTALAWAAAGEAWVGPALGARPELEAGLRLALGVAVGVFALTALKWVKEAKDWARGKKAKDH